MLTRNEPLLPFWNKTVYRKSKDQNKSVTAPSMTRTDGSLNTLPEQNVLEHGEDLTYDV